MSDPFEPENGVSEYLNKNNVKKMDSLSGETDMSSSESFADDSRTQSLKSPPQSEKSPAADTSAFGQFDDNDEGFMELKFDSPEPVEKRTVKPDSLRRAAPQRTKSFEGFKSPPVNQSAVKGDDGFGSLSGSQHGFTVSPASPGSLRTINRARKPDRGGLSSSMHGLGAPRSPGALMVKSRGSADNMTGLPDLERSRSRSPGRLSSRSGSPGRLTSRSNHGVNSSWRSAEAPAHGQSRSARLSRTLMGMQDAFDVDPFADGNNDDNDEFGNESFAFPEPDFVDPDFDAPKSTKSLQPSSMRDLASELQSLKQSLTQQQQPDDQTAKQARLEFELEALKSSLQQREADMMQKLSAKDEMIQRLAEQVEAVSLSTSQHSPGRMARRGSTGVMKRPEKQGRRGSTGAMGDLKAMHRERRRNRSVGSSIDSSSIDSIDEDEEIDDYEDEEPVSKEKVRKLKKTVSLSEKLDKDKTKKKKKGEEASYSSKLSKRSSKSTKSTKSSKSSSSKKKKIVLSDDIFAGIDAKDKKKKKKKDKDDDNRSVSSKSSRRSSASRKSKKLKPKSRRSITEESGKNEDEEEEEASRTFSVHGVPNDEVFKVTLSPVGERRRIGD